MVRRIYRNLTRRSEQKSSYLIQVRCIILVIGRNMKQSEMSQHQFPFGNNIPFSKQYSLLIPENTMKSLGMKSNFLNDSADINGQFIFYYAQKQVTILFF